jgi:hypothetical protein
VYYSRTTSCASSAAAAGGAVLVCVVPLFSFLYIKKFLELSSSREARQLIVLGFRAFPYLHASLYGSVREF